MTNIRQIEGAVDLMFLKGSEYAEKTAGRIWRPQWFFLLPVLGLI